MATYKNPTKELAGALANSASQCQQSQAQNQDLEQKLADLTGKYQLIETQLCAQDKETKGLQVDNELVDAKSSFEAQINKQDKTEVDIQPVSDIGKSIINHQEREDNQVITNTVEQIQNNESILQVDNSAEYQHSLEYELQVIDVPTVSVDQVVLERSEGTTQLK